MHELYGLTRGAKSDILRTALLVEEQTLTLETARSASMHIRKLATSLNPAATDPLLVRVVVQYCYGLLTVRFAPLWDDAVATLVEIASWNGQLVTSVAITWAEAAPSTGDGLSADNHSTQLGNLTNFECSNLMKLERLMESTEREMENAPNYLRGKVEKASNLLYTWEYSSKLTKIRLQRQHGYHPRSRVRRPSRCFMRYLN